MKRGEPYRDSTMTRADLSHLGDVLKHIKDRREVGMMIFVAIWGLSIQEAGEQLGLSGLQAERIFSRVRARLRHPSRAWIVKELDGGDFIMRSEELRRWTHAAAYAMGCVCICGRRFLPKKISSTAGGRPRLYCSNACRQSAYRARKRESPLPGKDAAPPS